MGVHSRLGVVDAERRRCARRRPRSARRGRRRLRPRRASRRRTAARRRSCSASARGSRGATASATTCSSVKIETCAWAAPSSRALSAARRSMASPRRLRQHAAGGLDPLRVIQARAHRYPTPSGASLGRLLGRCAAASSSGSAPTRRSNGPSSAQTAFSRSRAWVSTAARGPRSTARRAVGERLAPNGRRRPGRCPARPRPRTLRPVEPRVVAGERPDPPAQAGDAAVLGLLEHRERVAAEQLVVGLDASTPGMRQPTSRPSRRVSASRIARRRASTARRGGGGGAPVEGPHGRLGEPVVQRLAHPRMVPEPCG